jgi:hypothetical protein
MKYNKILRCNMLEYLIVKCHCISLAFAFVKQGTNFPMFAISQLLRSMTLVKGKILNIIVTYLPGTNTLAYFASSSVTVALTTVIFQTLIRN